MEPCLDARSEPSYCFWPALPSCLVGILDRDLSAVFARDTRLVPPLAADVRMTENTGPMRVGEGLLWRARTEPTSFKVYVADPVAGQVALQTRLKVVRHENGYRTANHPPSGGRLMPGPALSDPKTEAGQRQLKQSMLTCAARPTPGSGH